MGTGLFVLLIGKSTLVAFVQSKAGGFRFAVGTDAEDAAAHPSPRCLRGTPGVPGLESDRPEDVAQFQVGPFTFWSQSGNALFAAAAPPLSPARTRAGRNYHGTLYQVLPWPVPNPFSVSSQVGDSDFDTRRSPLGPICGQNGCMDFESATQELYGLTPTQFTAARDAKASEARQTGRPELASSIKKLRKPSVGAWLANLLVLEQSRDVERLIDLGAELRAPKRNLEGEQIRRVSKEKGDAVSKLVREATSKASRTGQSVSAAALQELEATLEAAFADPQAAESLRRGRLSSGLHYSGLGLGPPTEAELSTRARGSLPARSPSSKVDQVAAKRNLEKANREAAQADAHMEKARQALATAVDELTRLKSAEALAVRRSKEAHAQASAAKKKLSKQP